MDWRTDSLDFVSCLLVMIYVACLFGFSVRTRYVKKIEADVMEYKCRYDRRKNTSCPARLKANVYRDGSVQVLIDACHADHPAESALTEGAKKAIRDHKEANPMHKAQKIQQALAVSS